MDIVKKLICSKDKRLGGSGANEIKKHSWFKSIDWNQIRQGESHWVFEKHRGFLNWWW
jgi:hypothetical protein